MRFALMIVTFSKQQNFASTVVLIKSEPWKKIEDEVQPFN